MLTRAPATQISRASQSSSLPLARGITCARVCVCAQHVTIIVLSVLCPLWCDEVSIGSDGHSNAVLLVCPTCIHSGCVRSVLSQVCAHQIDRAHGDARLTRSLVQCCVQPRIVHIMIQPPIFPSA